MEANFELVNTKTVGKAVKAIQLAFAKKRELERTISKLIKDYEQETGLAIDMIRYQRDITIPAGKYKYTDLTIIVSKEEELEERNTNGSEEG